MRRKLPKLVIIIPCYNEEKTLADVIRRIPPAIPGFRTREILVINDGSADRTEAIALKLKTHVLSHTQNKGLGVAFRDGLSRALELGADVIVNIDADMQFDPRDIPQLTAPIVACRADMVTASRFLDPALIPDNMPVAKQIGNRGFTALVNFLTKRHFTDTQCGFRAYSREAALNLNVNNQFTYTQEVFIALVNKNFKILEIPIRVRYHKERKAKISSSLTYYGIQAVIIILRTFRDYKPLVFFGLPGVIVFVAGLIMDLWALTYVVITGQSSPVRMLFIVGAFLIIFGSLVMILALIADMFKRIRKNQEDILYRLKKHGLY